MKKDISANLHQKCLIFCSTIQLNVLQNLSLTVLSPWQHTGFQTAPILKSFLATFGIPVTYLQMVPHVHDPTSIKIWQLDFVALFNVFALKITYILKSSGWGLEKSQLPWEQNVLQPQVCFLQSYQATKCQRSALQIGQDGSIYILC